MSADPSDVPGPLVRPYAVTRGRTRSRVDIAIEALVATVPDAPRDTIIGRERQQIAELCQEVQSLAEIAAHTRMPLGVARVLVGDMAEEGLVQVHAPGSLDDQLGVYLLERVLSGLRKL